MRYFTLTLITFLITSKVVAESFQAGRLKTISLAAVKLVDLCSGKPVSSPTAGKIELWAEHCGNCLDKIEDSNPRELILINIDRPEDKGKACRKIRTLNRTSLSDAYQMIRAQLKDDFPIPAELNIKNGIVRDVKIGYWRQSQMPKK